MAEPVSDKNPDVAPSVLSVGLGGEVSADKCIELARELERLRAEEIVLVVMSLPIGGATAIRPTPFQSGYQLACEEVMHRLQTEEWKLNLPPDAIPMGEGKPPAYTEVLVWLSWPDDAIKDFPAVAWNSPYFGTDSWWSGIPGQYIGLDTKDITHWMLLTPNVRVQGQAEAERCSASPGTKG